MFFLKFVVFFCGFAIISANTNCPHNLCNYANNYPEKDILSALSRNSSFNGMFGDIFRPEIDVSDRYGEGSYNVCPTKQVTYAPKSGRNIFNEMINIVNVDGYSQTVTIEVCQDDAKSKIDCHLPGGYRTYCETQHATIRLVVYNAEGSLETQKFSIPSGCVCTYEAEYD